MFLKKYFKILMMGMIVISFPSCTGILGGIYDDPADSKPLELGFNNVDEQQHSGTLYADATSYTQWTYVDFTAKTIEVREIIPDQEAEVPQHWHIALHRYDVKTNGASVIETGFKSLKDFMASGKFPDGEYKADVDSKVSIDMSQMAQGIIIYSPTHLNVELGKWLNVDTSDMPPIYTKSGNVYVARFADNSYAAFLLSNYMNDKKTKGFMTLDYIYPVEF